MQIGSDAETREINWTITHVSEDGIDPDGRPSIALRAGKNPPVQ